MAERTIESALDELAVDFVEFREMLRSPAKLPTFGEPLDFPPLRHYGNVEPWNVKYAVQLLGLYIKEYWKDFERAWEAFPEELRERLAVKVHLLELDREVANLNAAVAELRWRVAQRGAAC